MIAKEGDIEPEPCREKYVMTIQNALWKKSVLFEEVIRIDFYNCKYVDVISGRYGNEYTESYRCVATGGYCKCCQCKLTEEEDNLFFWREKINRKIIQKGQRCCSREMIMPFWVKKNKQYY